MNPNNYEYGYQRGCIYYVYRAEVTGSEQMAGRPAIIVSNNKCNTYSSTVEVVYLTTQPKNDLPTHVTIRSSTRPSIALCEQIHTVDTSRFGEFVAICTEQEMDNIDAALMISLGLDAAFAEPQTVEVIKEVEVVKEVVKEVPVEVVKESVCNNDELIAAKAQIAQLQAMYNSLLERLIAPPKRSRKKEED